MQALATGFRRALPRIAIALAAASACECATALDWALEVTPDKALFPVLDLSQARRPDDGSAGGGSGSVAVRVRGEAGQRVRLTIEMPGLSEPAVVAAALPAAGTLELRPRLQWDRGRIGSLRASTFQTLVATLQTTDGTIQTRELGVRLHPLEDALYYVRVCPSSTVSGLG